ncbi:MAG: chitobiase/beta-hexosaminidase C-terminal domain-containing protein [Bacteroides sp.]|nr:chitobiase/beta-hexosaminidase C-terminal domain-containing protein [Bacteroides sp.]MCM1389819.1 chitobiase/beta-hexosaminidase C-terminal domain-containing protein [Bacteroides sp.]
MKKFLTLVAALIMAVGANAQDATDPVEETVTWKAADGAPNNIVELKNSKEELVIKAELLNNTSKGNKPEDIGAGVWIYKKDNGGYWTCSDKNGLEVRFTPLTDGILEVVTAADIALTKNVNMFVNDDVNNTMDATCGELTLLSGVNLQDQGFETTPIKKGTPVSYGIKAGNTYNFYFNGTKWRFGSFSFTPGKVEGGVEEAKKVAFVTANEAEDMAFQTIDASRLDATLIGANDEVTLDSLQKFDAVIVSYNVTADAKMVPVLKSAIAYQPMVNLSAALYEAWGLGKAVATEATGVTVVPAFADDETFLTIANGDPITLAGTISSIELGDYFAKDDTIATIDGKVAIHRHNANRNAYINLPYTAECMPEPGVIGTLLADLTVSVAKTKKGVIATTTPKIAQANADMETTVTITAAAGAVIYYTTDGTEPTEASTVYTEPLVLHDAATVKAFATLDGYLPSSVATLDAVIMSQIAAPTFIKTNDETSTTVEIQCSDAAAELYYSYREFTDPAKAQKYVEPITLSQEPTLIYAMAIAENRVNSNLAVDYVSINSLNKNTIRMDTVSHFSASEAAWMPTVTPEGSEGKSSAFYYWGKKAWAHYSTDIDHTEEIKGSDGQDSTVIYYKPDPAARKVIEANEGTENDWRLVSSGQVLTGELTLAPEASIGNGVAGRYAETAEDLIGGTPSTGVITYGAKTTGEPYTGSIESTKKFTAPFDVVTYVGNGNNGSAANLEIQVSADGENWTSIASVKMAATQRYYKKTRASQNEAGDYFVRVAHVGGSTKGQLYDIYILNNGEISQKYEPVSGIEDVEVAEVEVVRTEIYNISGMLMPEMIEGINIVRTYYSDGSVKTTKVLNR